jgi:uncharacterized membrane protein
VRFNHVATGGMNRHIVILIASAMHLSWAAALLFAPLHTTGIQLVLDLSFGSHIIAAILCAAVSLAAVAAIFCRNPTLFVFLVLPQQFLLIASAIGAVYCVIDGKFADWRSLSAAVHLRRSDLLSTALRGARMADCGPLA